jgi:hypothetical protein
MYRRNLYGRVALIAAQLPPGQRVSPAGEDFVASIWKHLCSPHVSKKQMKSRQRVTISVPGVEHGHLTALLTRAGRSANRDIG